MDVPLETMIREVGNIEVWTDGDRWYASTDSGFYDSVGDTPREAIEALYAAWKAQEG